MVLNQNSAILALQQTTDNRQQTTDNRQQTTVLWGRCSLCQVPDSVNFPFSLKCNILPYVLKKDWLSRNVNNSAFYIPALEGGLI